MPVPLAGGILTGFESPLGRQGRAVSQGDSNASRQACRSACGMRSRMALAMLLAWIRRNSLAGPCTGRSGAARQRADRPAVPPAAFQQHGFARIDPQFFREGRKRPFTGVVPRHCCSFP